jgi:hypothetical protein
LRMMRAFASSGSSNLAAKVGKLPSIVLLLHESFSAFL